MELFEQLEALRKSLVIPDIDVNDPHLDEDGPPFFPKGNDRRISASFDTSSTPSIKFIKKLSLMKMLQIADETS